MSDLGFKLMSFGFKLRDFFKPRKEVVEEVGLNNGFQVLDYGCGPGGYVLAVSEAVGASGKLYALDINPVAIEMVKKIIAKNKLENVETILSDCATGLADETLDAVLLYDVFHGLSDPNGVLKELCRVLKPNGVLSFSDHHFNESDITSKVTGSGLFKLQKKGKVTYTFSKQTA
jgi:ubiquinone/menaquinone biosynthesis C-methylase UbiE